MKYKFNSVIVEDKGGETEIPGNAIILRTHVWNTLPTPVVYKIEYLEPIGEVIIEDSK